MGRIPFIEARFFDPRETRSVLESRFEDHLHRLRSRRLNPAKPTRTVDDGGKTKVEDCDYLITDRVLLIKLGGLDTAKIQRRTSRVIEQRKAACGLDHLKREDRERLEVLKDGAELVEIRDAHRADEIAAELHGDMPWMGAATEIVWHAMRRSVREGWDGLRLPPILLDGPPGIGKSHWARRLGELLATPTTTIEATTESASFGLVGSQRGWGGSCPGRLIETVLQSRIANPVLVLDEIDKAGTPTSTKGQTFSLSQSLLPLLEPMTASRWSCPYFQVRFDMSWVIWVLTSNDFRALSAPLLSRCPPVRLRDLTTMELEGFVRRQGAARDLSQNSIEAIIEVLTHPSLRHHRPSLRVAARMLQRASDLEHLPPLQ